MVWEKREEEEDDGSFLAGKRGRRKKKRRSECSVSTLLSARRCKLVSSLVLLWIFYLQVCEGWRKSPKPCFPTSTGSPRFFGEPCHLAFSQTDENFNLETTVEERMSRKINPVPFIFGPFIQRNIGGILGLEQSYLLSSPSVLKLCLKIILRLFRN